MNVSSDKGEISILPGDAAKKKMVSYTVDLQAGYHRYVQVDGVGECREHFARLVDDLDKRDIDGVVVAKAEYLFVDTSPMWMEKFITAVKRRGIVVADATSGKEYDLRLVDDEVAFRALGNRK